LGVTRGEPRRFVHGHNSRLQQRVEGWVVEDRGYVTPCHIWQGQPQGGGYGLAFGEDGRKTTAHRVIYEREVGPIPDGLQLDHLCRVRICVNPEHMEPVTNAENARRGKRTTLTHSIAARIRARRRAGEAAADIAAEFGISRSSVYGITNGRRWA